MTVVATAQQAMDTMMQIIRHNRNIGTGSRVLRSLSHLPSLTAGAAGKSSDNPQPLPALQKEVDLVVAETDLAGTSSGITLLGANPRDSRSLFALSCLFTSFPLAF